MPKKPAPIYKLTRQQAEKDSMVFGAIMAGVKSKRKKLKPLKQRLAGMETPKGMCAVGAGLRGVKRARLSDIVTKSYEKEHGAGGSNTTRHQLVPLVRFAAFMDVSENYACGVNDGFENSLGTSRSFYRELDMTTLDYERGWHVGQAVAIDSGF